MTQEYTDYFTNRTTENGFKLALTQERLINGVLYQMHVQPSQYEDCFQEAIIDFVQAYLRYPDNIEDNPKKFFNYAYQFLKWQILMHFRQTTQQQQMINYYAEDDFVQICNQQPSNLQTDAKLITTDLLNQLLATCTAKQRQFIHLRISQEASLTEIAKQMGCSRRNVNYIKLTIQEKLKSLLAEQP